MNEQQTRAAFAKILEKYKSTLDEKLTEGLLEDFDHGEAAIAFQILLDNLQEMDTSVNDATRQELRAIAESLGMLEDARGKGIYWD